MNDGELVELVRQAILSGLIVIAPMLCAGFAVATVVGFVPRLVAMAATLLITMPWMVERLADMFRTAAGP
jgi:flagellar biosynthesis protein FliQ